MGICVIHMNSIWLLCCSLPVMHLGLVRWDCHSYHQHPKHCLALHYLHPIHLERIAPPSQIAGTLNASKSYFETHQHQLARGLSLKDYHYLAGLFLQQLPKMEVEHCFELQDHQVLVVDLQN